MITSISNPRIKNLLKLKKQPKERSRQNSFIVEGPRMFFEIPKERLRACYLTERFEEEYSDRLQDYRYELVSEKVLKHLADTTTPQGVVAVAARQETSLEEVIGQVEYPCLFLLENLQDPGNMGTIIRTAEAAGIDAVIISRDSVDPYNSKVIRSTMGAIFRVAVLIVDDLSETIAWLKNHEVDIYAAHLQGEIFYRYDYTKGCAFLIGNEGNGLKKETVLQADYGIRIPMKGRVESLNAAVSATVLMYEVVRQRTENNMHKV